MPKQNGNNSGGFSLDPVSNDGAIGTNIETGNPADSGDSGSAATTIDPASLAGTNSGDNNGNAGTGERKRGRGRPRGSTNKRHASSQNSQGSLDVNAVEMLLLNTHNMAAMLLKVKELELDKAEAEMLAKATAQVARHYNLGVSEKAIDWTNLMQALSLVYGTRIYAIHVRRKEERTAKGPSIPKASTAQPQFRTMMQ